MSENVMIPERNIETVTNEILMLKHKVQEKVAVYIIEIGRRLVEAKAIIPHGEWGDWLKNRVEFSQKSANDYMNFYREYGDEQLSLLADSSNSQALSNLSYTKALALIAIPREEREEFIEENDVENISTRELDKLIKERNEALKRAEEAEKLQEVVENEKARAERYEREAARSAENTKELTERVNDLNLKLEKAKEAEKKAKAKVKNMKENPTVPQEVLDKLKAEAEAEAAQKSAKELEEKNAQAAEELKAAQLAKEDAEREKQKAIERAEKLEKQLKLQNPDVMEFKRLFEQVQGDIVNMENALNKLKASDPELSDKFSAAVQALFKQHIKE
ncbi:MAG: DUF3102 domain-containing protein [Clostridia bacterium]|nr:DUF3102 domain-containing protein [Clostridia bacterium]